MNIVFRLGTLISVGLIFSILLGLFSMPLHAIEDPDVLINWSKKRNKQFLDVKLTGEDPLFAQCLNSGLNLQYQYELKLCRRRSLWFDSCNKTRKAIFRLHLDSATGMYSFVGDLLGDQLQPEKDQFDSEDAAKGRIRAIIRYPMELLTGQVEEVDLNNTYLSVKVLSDCYGKRGQLASNISRVLTLGLVQVQGFDTGWIDFTLHDSTSR